LHEPPTGDVPTQRFPDETKAKAAGGNAGQPTEGAPNQISRDLFVAMIAIIPKKTVVGAVIAKGMAHQIEVVQHALDKTSARFWNVEKNCTVFK